MSFAPPGRSVKSRRGNVFEFKICLVKSGAKRFVKSGAKRFCDTVYWRNNN